MKIGFIGLGNMGLPMALNLHKAGFEVYGKNRSEGKERRFAELGGNTGLGVAELAAQMDVVVTCLPLPADVEDVYLGEQGLLGAAKKDLVMIDCSTVSPELNRKIFAVAEESGCHFLDAPVSGGTTGAAAGTLSIMVGGRKEVFDRVRSVLEALGEQLYYVGGSGSGSAVKLINQLMVGIHSQAVSEAFALGQSAGLDADVLFNILHNSFAQSRIMERHFTQFIATGETEPGFALKLLAKDVNLVADMAEQHRVGLPAGNRVRALLNRAVEFDYGEWDMARLYDLQNKTDTQLKEAGPLKLYAAILMMRDEEKNATHRPAHLQYLEQLRAAGHIFAYGRFVDGAGGLIIYRAHTLAAAEKMARQDPYVIHGARHLSVHEWAALLADG